MELRGTHIIPLPRRQVWSALNDPDVLRACIPGCRELTKTADDRFAATVASKIGPVSAVFVGEVQLSNIVPDMSYTIAGSGKGGIAGFAKGRSEVSLADIPEGTRLSYTATAEIGGKLASVGSRLLQGVARRTADEFFATLVDQLAPAFTSTETVAQAKPALSASVMQPAAALPPQAIPLPLATPMACKPATERSPALPWIIAAAGWIVATFLAGRLLH
jgi:carbon monoxide dehydrogenase subunit G